VNKWYWSHFVLNKAHVYRTTCPTVTVTRSSHSDLLTNHIRPTIRWNYHGLLSTSVQLQPENAWPNITARATVEISKDIHFGTRLTSLLVITISLSQWSRLLMGRLSDLIRCKIQCFEWLCLQPEDCFSREIQALAKCCETCTAINSDRFKITKLFWIYLH
jgi:hypothetical protein